VIALEVRGISKNYPLRSTQWSRLRQVFAPGAVRYRDGLWALREIDFTVDKGEAFGVVGANGSGKSTLLQIVAGILRPTSGEIAVHGRLSALLELGSGFSPEFTGRQNVRLNASILGLSSAEIDRRFETIESFASIGDFIDQPVRTYSTGMVLRLAFAVVAHVDPEILIVDEALAVGDIAFRQRCMRKIHELRARGTTILFVSHDTGDVKALCERCLWLDKGRIRSLGAADEVVGAYLSAMIQRESVREVAASRREIEAAPGHVAAGASQNLSAGRNRFGSGRASITFAELKSDARAVVLTVGFRVDVALSLPIVGFLVRNSRGETIFGSNTAHEDCPLPLMAPGDSHAIDFHWTMPELAPGKYFISLGVSEGTLESFEVCDYVEDSLTIDVPAGPDMRGYLRLPCSSVMIHRHGAIRHEPARNEATQP
jgi:lipopolysaccharide transport system ATP-binding protein